jgi:predicted exporter
MSWRTAGALVGVSVALVVYCAFNLSVGTNLQHFMPDGEKSALAEISQQLADSPLTRTMVLSVESSTLDNSIGATRELAEIIRTDPAVAWVRTGIDEAQIQDLFEIYFPRRFYLLSDRPESEIPDHFGDDSLRAHARALKRQLATPISALLRRIAPADPTSSFRAIAERFREGESQLEMKDGQLVTPDGSFAITMLGTRESAFNSGAQAKFLTRLRTSFDAIAARRGGDLRLEMSGANRFAVAAEQSIKRDVYRIGASSFLGVAALFFLFIGGWRSFLIVSVPPLAGILVATSLGLATLGGLDGLTIAFGASLMGIAIDYSNHILIHQQLAVGSETPRETARRIRPSLTLGAATTIASFGGLAVTSFPAFREMSFFAAVGVITALIASLVVLPDLIPYASSLPSRSAATAEWLGRLVAKLERHPKVLLSIPLILLPLAGLSLTRLEWSDDMSELTNFPPELIEEGRRVRERTSSLDSSRFVVGIATDSPSAITLNDRIHGRLQTAIEAGELGGGASLHRMLWSEGLQRRNWELVSADSTIYPRLDAAFVAEGFRPGAFRAFGEALAERPPAPLTLDDLETSPLAEFLTPFVFPLGDQIAVVSYLRDLRSPEALRARLSDLEGVYLLDQGAFVNEIYREFRVNTLQQIGVGGALVGLILLIRYRHWRRALVSFAPAVIVAIVLLSILAISGVRANLLHAMSLIMVMGMGVDYGVFLVDSAGDREALGATMLSLLMSCLTTVFVFGTLALSSQPSLRAIGVTTGLGILLCYLLAPVTLAALGSDRAAETRNA